MMDIRTWKRVESSMVQTEALTREVDALRAAVDELVRQRGLVDERLQAIERAIAVVDPGPGEIGAWLRSMLAAGPMSAREVKSRADEAGYAWRTVQRVAAAAGVRSRREGFAGGATWLIGAIRATAAAAAPVLNVGATGGATEADDPAPDTGANDW